MTIAPNAGSHLCIVLPDLHIPNQDPEASRIAFKIVELLKPRKVVILGDWLDCEGFSTHPKIGLEEAAEQFLHSEIRPCNEALDFLQHYCEELVYIEGNHEDRVRRWVTGSKQEHIADLISPRRLLSAGRENFTWVPYVPEPGSHPLPHYEITPDLWAVHGWSYCTHVAAKHLTMGRGKSVVFGHCHRVQSVTERQHDGTLRHAWSPGCLSQVQPVWRHNSPTKWVHGLSLVYVKDDGSSFTPYTVTIERGKAVLPGGQTVTP